ncbi:hypothetical protein BJX64DRAFT_265745 [Aspergillus heterothallicus]
MEEGETGLDTKTAIDTEAVMDTKTAMDTKAIIDTKTVIDTKAAIDTKTALETNRHTGRTEDNNQGLLTLSPCPPPLINHKGRWSNHGSSGKSGRDSGSRGMSSPSADGSALATTRPSSTRVRKPGYWSG